MGSKSHSSDAVLRQSLSALLKHPTYDGETTSSFLFKVGQNTGINLALPFTLESVQVNLRELGLVGDMAFPKAWSSTFSAELDNYEPEVPVLMRDQHIKGIDAIYLVLQCEVDRSQRYFEWTKSMRKPRVFMRARNKAGLLVFAWPFQNFFK